MKTCCKCKENKNLDEFHRCSRSEDGLNRRCKECVNGYNRNQYKINPEYSKKRKLRLSLRTEEQIENARQNGRDWYNTPTGRAKTLMKGVIARNKKYKEVIDFDENYLKEIIENGRCQVTGLPFILGSKKDGKKRAYSPSIDRIDNSKGYCKSNVRIVIWQFNLMKGELSDEELLELCYITIESLENFDE